MRPGEYFWFKICHFCSEFRAQKSVQAYYLALLSDAACLLRFRRCSVYESSAVFPLIPNIRRITVRYSASHISAVHETRAYTRAFAAALSVAYNHNH